MIKVDKSLEEVWEMKREAYNDFKNSSYDDIIDFINDETEEIRKKYKIKYHFENVHDEEKIR